MAQPVSPYRPVDPQNLEARTVAGLHDALVAHLPAPSTVGAVLDLGCGTGAWLRFLQGRGYRGLHGVDIDVTGVPADLGVIRRADLDQADIGLGEQRFPLVTSIEVVEHLENPGRLFAHAARHLEPGGVFIMTTPNIHSLRARVRYLLTGRMPYFDEKSDPTHVTPIHLGGLARIASRHGLRVARRWPYPERGSLVFRREIQWLETALRRVLPDETPGDISCLELRHADPSHVPA